MKLPLNLYLTGSVERSDYQIEGAEFEKNSESSARGFHFSIADIFKKVSYKKLELRGKVFRFLFGLGPKKWELVEVEINKSGTDIIFLEGLG
ncbi:MAG: hypothetical protein Ct9H300mP20_11150 [Gammaproteobacteria bacterium]|nr:MAG: hypothetical protein Ct9H300mP20_11150 [Gammaproteobacteria bacterium]